jgi:two-component system response regulator RegX3
LSKLLLVEDDETLREALGFLLGREGHQVVRAADGAQALEAFESDPPDLVLLDLMIPEVPGTEVARRIRLVSDVPIIMLTAKDAEADVVMGFELGADDYVTKPYSTPELLARIRRALRRAKGRAAPPGPDAPDAGMLAAGGVAMDLERHKVWVDGEEVHLPLREFSILELLLAHPGRVITRAGMFSRLWGKDYYGESKTLDVHIRRLRAKIEPDPANPTRVLTVRGVGYRFDDEP